MLRAPICTTSAWAKIASACWLSSSSVTTGSPVFCRASARISSASAPGPLNASGEGRGLKAPPRSMDAPASLTARATPSVCSRDSTVHGPAMRQNVSPPPTRRPSISTIVGCSWLSSDEASLYGREIGTTRSTPAIPSSPSSATPSGSPIAPIAVVSVPGMTTTSPPAPGSRSRTASISASAAPGCMTIIIRGRSYVRTYPGWSSAGTGADAVQLRVAQQARDAARPDRPDAADRHRERPADLLVVRRRVAGEHRHEQAVALGQRRQCAVEDRMALGGQQLGLGPVLLALPAQLGIVGELLAQRALQDAQAFAPCRRRQPAAD